MIGYWYSYFIREVFEVFNFISDSISGSCFFNFIGAENFRVYSDLKGA